MLDGLKTKVRFAPLDAARTSQLSAPPLSLIDDVHIGEALPLSSFGGEGWGEEALYPCRPSPQDWLHSNHAQTGKSDVPAPAW